MNTYCFEIGQKWIGKWGEIQEITKIRDGHVYTKLLSKSNLIEDKKDFYHLIDCPSLVCMAYPQ